MTIKDELQSIRNDFAEINVYGMRLSLGMNDGVVRSAIFGLASKNGAVGVNSQTWRRQSRIIEIYDRVGFSLVKTLSSGEFTKLAGIAESARTYQYLANKCEPCFFKQAGDGTDVPEVWICDEIRDLTLIAIDSLLVSCDRKSADPSVSSLVSRKDLLEILEITSAALNYRINEMGFPKPVKSEGKKQWFSVDEIDIWRKNNR